jgi:hypothetical protein
MAKVTAEATIDIDEHRKIWVQIAIVGEPTPELFEAASEAVTNSAVKQLEKYKETKYPVRKPDMKAFGDD